MAIRVPTTAIGASEFPAVIMGVTPSLGLAVLNCDANGSLQVSADVIVGDLINIAIGGIAVDGNKGDASAQTQRVVEADDGPVASVFGTPDGGDAGTIAFDADANDDLDASSTYLVIASEDCHIGLRVNGGSAVTTSNMFLPANQFFALRTTVTLIELHAIKNATAGTLYYQKMT